MDEIELFLKDNETSKNLSKKELLDISREKQKLDLNIGGIRTLNGKQDLLIVFDVIKDKIAIFFGKIRIVTNAEIITHEAPVNAPSSSCFLIILLKNKLKKYNINLKIFYTREN